MKKLAIIGNGMATSRLLDEILRRDPNRQFQISVFGEESHGSYNRILLGRILAGEGVDEITLKAREWYADRGVTYHAATMIARLDPLTKLLHDLNGQTYEYDVAVFATGSSAFIPPLENLRNTEGRILPGAFPFRTVDDCSRMRVSARPASSAVVLGGGLLGLEAARSLSDLGLHVTVLHQAEWLMNMQVDRQAGEFIRTAVQNLGIFVRTGVAVTGVHGEDRVRGVMLSSGEIIPADSLVIAAGIRPRVEVAQAAGIPVKRGIVVNDLLATSVPGVFAVGECAEHNGMVYGIVPPIWEQCEVLADVLTGANPTSRYRGSRLYTKLKVAGVEVASMGLVNPQYDSDEVVQIVEERRGIYRKLVFRENKLVGAILVGDNEAAPTLARWFDRGDTVPKNRLDLLCSGDISVASADPEVCNCHHVCESTLKDAIGSGCTTLPALSAATKAGTGCGSCRGQLTNLIMKHSKVST